MVTFAVCAPLTGWALDRFGPRLLFSAGALLFAGGLLMSSWISTQWQLYLWYGIIASVGITILGLSNYGTLIARWFRRQRGAAMGLAFAGTGIGTLVIVPLTERWITAWGWRLALVGQAGLLAAIVLPLSFIILRLSPLELGLTPDGDGSSRAANPGVRLSNPVLTGYWTLHEAMHTPAFWLLIVASFGALFSLRMLTVHQVAAAVDAGFERFFAAQVMGFSGAITVFAFIGWGLLADRMGRRRAFVVSSTTLIGAIMVLLIIRDASQDLLLYLYAVLFGLGEGSRISLLTAFMSDTFPGESVGRINGFVGMAFGAGAAAGSWLAGYLYDLTGNYALALWVALGVTVLSAGCVALTARSSAVSV
jgi:MFS family permease